MKEIEPIVRIESDLQTLVIKYDGSWTTTYVFFQSAFVTAQSKILSFQNLSDRFDALRNKKIRLENLVEIISKFSEARDAGYLFAVHDGLFDDVLEEHYHLSENDDLLHEQGRLDLAL